jgi:hypothetical protein
LPSTILLCANELLTYGKVTGPFCSPQTNFSLIEMQYLNWFDCLYFIMVVTFVFLFFLIKQY